MLSFRRVGMTRLLLITFLAYCSLAAASACEDGALEVVQGTRCRKYAECQSGSWHLKDCRFGQIFDPKSLKCSPAMGKGSCNDGSKCSEGRAYSYLGNDSLYYRCINGRISVQVCGAGEVFDYILQHCRPLEMGFIRSKRNSDKTCEEGSRRRDGKSCKDYIECINGQEIKKTCTDCMNYDDKSQKCRFVFIVPCEDETITTTTPPSTTRMTPPESTTQGTTPEGTTQGTTPEGTTQGTTPEGTTQGTTPEGTTQGTTPEGTTQGTTPEGTTQGTTPEGTTQGTTPEGTSGTTPEGTTQGTTPEGTTEGTSTAAPPCKEGEKVGLVDPECKAYKECKNGVWVNDSCGWGKEFDSVDKKCKYFWWQKVKCTTS